MSKIKRLLVIWTGPSDGTSANLFKQLGSVAAQEWDVRYSPDPLSPGGAISKLFSNVLTNISRFRDIWWSDYIVVHSYASLSLITILIARLLRKKVAIIHWDVYPTTIAGVGRRGVLRKLADSLENFTVSLATTVVIPSDDFTDFVDHANRVIIPLWPSSSPLPVVNHKISDMIQIAFVGQIDKSRGLEEAIQAIREAGNNRVEFHIFSSGGRLEQSGRDDSDIHYYPRLAREEVVARVSQMHFGLISLHRQLDQPGFPSKTFDYLAANLPILYFGRKLPAYCNSLTETGVGYILEGQADLAKIYSEMQKDWVARRNMFLSQTKLDMAKLQLMFSTP